MNIRAGARRHPPIPAALVCSFILATIIAPKAARASGFDEVWIGGFAHDVADIGRGKESGTGDFQIEVDSEQPKGLRFLGAPRLNATLMLNSAGLTNSGSVGLTWNHRFSCRLYGSIDFGLGLTDGMTTAPAGPDGAYDPHLIEAIDCSWARRWCFARRSASIGGFRVTGQSERSLSTCRPD